MSSRNSKDMSLFRDSLCELKDSDELSFCLLLSVLSKYSKDILLSIDSSILSESEFLSDIILGLRMVVDT